jgi:hypothetical protein
MPPNTGTQGLSNSAGPHNLYSECRRHVCNEITVNRTPERSGGRADKPQSGRTIPTTAKMFFTTLLSFLGDPVGPETEQTQIYRRAPPKLQLDRNRDSRLESTVPNQSLENTTEFRQLEPPAARRTAQRRHSEKVFPAARVRIARGRIS